MSRLTLFATFLCASLNAVQNAKILCIFEMPSYSHQKVFQPIWKELSLRGHEVTVLTPNPLNDSNLTNLTEISLSFVHNVTSAYKDFQTSLDNHLSITDILKYLYTVLTAIIKSELTHGNFQTFIRNKTTRFDLILAQYYPSQPAVLALSERFRCPLVGITSAATLLVGHDAVGKPTHPVLYPDVILPFINMPGLFERIYSTYYATWYRFYNHRYFLPDQEEMVKTYISKDLSYIGNIEKNLSVLISNENPIFYTVSPSVPAFIRMGLNKPFNKGKPLPEDLQRELDNAKQGAIYFSFGSNVKTIHLSEKLRKIITEALSELPYKILWKWEVDYLPGQHDNVIIRKWFPQMEILGHPNIKALVTQGGAHSLEEAIFHGVPIVGIPFIFDQTSNVLRMARLGIGEALDTRTVTKEQLKATVIAVAENPKYRNKVKEISVLMSDVPMTGLEEAIWWIEYVIRHKGALHLRSPAVSLPWYQYLLLDVTGFVIGAIFVLIFVMYRVIWLSIMIAEEFIRQL